MEGIFLGIGSNIDPERNVRSALLLLKERVRILRLSTFYLSEPENRPDQPLFYNGAAEVETDLPPFDLKFSVLRKIEGALNRARSEDRNAPRTIDLDILVYGERVIAEKGLVIPDPEIPARPFLAVPLHELAPNLVLPGLNRKTRELVVPFQHHGMRALEAFTRELKKELLP